MYIIALFYQSREDDSFYLNVMVDDLRYGGYITEVFSDDIYPIELTKEILKLNNFVFDYDTEGQIREAWAYDEHDYLELSLIKGKYYTYVYDHDVPVFYVHKLQNIYRLSGKHEEADKIKLQR